jgi:hypothetical protein
MSGGIEPMNAARNATVIAVDYQRARHAAAGRRRVVDAKDAGGSGMTEVFVALLATGFVVVAAYLSAEGFWAEGVTTAREAEARVAMEAGRRFTTLPQARVSAGAEILSSVRR